MAALPLCQTAMRPMPVPVVPTVGPLATNTAFITLPSLLFTDDLSTYITVVIAVLVSKVGLPTAMLLPSPTATPLLAASDLCLLRQSDPTVAFRPTAAPALAVNAVRPLAIRHTAT